MYLLVNAIPDPDVVLALEPEELGAKLLFLVRKGGLQNGIFHPGNLANEGMNSWSPSGGTSPHKGREKEIGLAVAEAFAWLEAQALIVPAEGTNGTNGFRRFSRRAARFEDEAAFKQYAVARRLPKESLHSRIAEKVWMAFMRGEFDVAVFQAMKAVEVAVRDATGIPELGVSLMRKAFHPEDGPLTDKTVEKGEREARTALFAGAIGSYKNPHSHRDVPLDDAGEATEVILLANHLLRIVDSRRRAVP